MQRSFYKFLALVFCTVGFLFIVQDTHAQNYIITTIAGNGKNGHDGDNGPATSASLSNPSGVGLDHAGNIYIVDRSNNCIRKVTPNGTITTFAGNGTIGFSGDGGAAISAELNSPSTVAADRAGNVYIADWGNQRIRKVDVNGIITTFAGSGVGTPQSYGDNGLATAARIHFPYGVAVDAADNVYISEQWGFYVRKVDVNGIITTVSGSGNSSYAGDGVAATAAGQNPFQVAFDSKNNMYVVDLGNNRIRKVNAAGVISTFAGNGKTGYTGDSLQATAASIYNPLGIAIDKWGTVFVTDPGNNRLWKIDTNNIITVLAGTGQFGYTGDGGPSVLARIGDIEGLAVDSIGNIYMTDFNYNRVRKLSAVSCTTPGILTTIPADTAICNGATVSLQSSGASTYAWSPATGLNCNTCANPVANPTATTTYIVRGLNGGCSIADTVVVHVDDKVQPGIVTVVRDTICQGTTAKLTLTGSSGSTIQWLSSVTQSNFANVTGADSAVYKTEPLLQTTFYYARVGAGNCSVSSDSIRLYVPPALTAAFTSAMASPNQVTFNSGTSVGNISSYFWDFGDGQTSTEINPVHTYSNDSTYNVCLTIYDGSNCSYTYCRNVDVKANGVLTIDAEVGWNIYPNPFTDMLNISGVIREIKSVEICDMLGRAMLTITGITTSANSLSMAVPELERGIYFLRISTKDADYTSKIIKQ